MGTRITNKQWDMIKMLAGAGCPVRIAAKDKRTAELLVTKGYATRADGGYRITPKGIAATSLKGWADPALKLKLLVPTLALILGACAGEVDDPEPTDTPDAEPACVLMGEYVVTQYAESGCAPSQSFRALAPSEGRACSAGTQVCNPGEPADLCSFDSSIGPCRLRVTWERVD